MTTTAGKITNKGNKAIVSVEDVGIPAGYKLTELGLIPEDWEVKPFGQMAEITMGQSPIGISYNRKSIGVPLINGPTEFTKKHPIKIQWTTQPTKLCKNGDILLCVRGSSTGRMNISNDLYCIGRGIASIRAKLEVDLSFISFQLNSTIQTILTLTTGSTFPNIDGKTIRSIEFLLPSIKEQQAIAAALSDIDSLITSLDQLITKKRDIKQAAMQQLLTGKQRLPGFSGEWKSKKLGDIAFCYSGGTPPTSNLYYYNGDISWITSGDLNQRYIKNVKGRITELGLNNSSAQMVKKDSLLIALYGATAGVTAITKIDAAINQAILAVIPKNDHVDFLFHYFELRKDWLINTYTQGGQPNLSGDIVKAIEFLMPGIEEQTAIASILSGMDNEISALEQQLDKTRNLKQGMMQELLTGRIRLV